jgi:predicted Fe-S protein YdhL (DUF1289 family)
MHEIASWSGFSAEEKRQIHAELPLRRMSAPPLPAIPGRRDRPGSGE